MTKIENGVPVYVGPECESIGGSIAAEMSTSQTREVLSRLAAYEDAGLLPEEVAEYKKFEDEAVSKGVSFARIVELLEADKDGRVVIFPCKAGDTAWYRTWAQNATVDLGIQPHEVVATRAHVIADGAYCNVGLNVDHFCKTWFLTREEAEAALKEASHEV